MDMMLVFMFKNSAGRFLPGTWNSNPGDRNAKSAAAMMGAAQFFIVFDRPPFFQLCIQPEITTEQQLGEAEEAEEEEEGWLNQVKGYDYGKYAIWDLKFPGGNKIPMIKKLKNMAQNYSSINFFFNFFP